MKKMGQKLNFFDEKRGAYKKNFAPRRPRRALRGPKQYLGRSAELKSGIKVDFGAIWSILGVGNGSKIAIFAEEMEVSKEIFASQRPGTKGIV